MCRLNCFNGFVNVYIYIYFRENTYDRYECMLSLVNSVLTSINSEFTGVNMKIATRRLSEVILISGPGRDISMGRCAT